MQHGHGRLTRSSTASSTGCASSRVHRRGTPVSLNNLCYNVAASQSPAVADAQASDYDSDTLQLDAEKAGFDGNPAWASVPAISAGGPLLSGDPANISYAVTRSAIYAAWGPKFQPAGKNYEDATNNCVADTDRGGYQDNHEKYPRRHGCQQPGR